MKRLAFALLSAFVCSSCAWTLYTEPQPQMVVATVVNISAQPLWGPVGYQCAPYYYFPDYNFYYDVNNAMFYYPRGSRWIAVRQLPPMYPHDLYKFYKVVIDTRDPWLYNRSHRSMYRKYKGVHTQQVLRDYPDFRRYYSSPREQADVSDRHNNTPYRDNGQNGNNQGNNQDNRNTVRNSRNNNTATNPAGQGTRRNDTSTRQNNTATTQSTQKSSSSSRSGSTARSGDSSSASSGRGSRSNSTSTSTTKSTSSNSSNSSSSSSKSNSSSTSSSKSNSSSASSSKSSSSSSRSGSSSSSNSSSSSSSRSTGSRGR